MSPAELVQQNKSLAFWIAKKAAGRMTSPIDRENVEGACLLALWRAALTYEPSRGYKFCTYATRVIQYAAYDALRRECRHAPLFAADRIEEGELAAPAQADVCEKDDEAEALWRAVDQLGGRSAEAVRMRYQGKLQLGQVAERLGVSRTRTRQIIVRALKRLRRRESLAALA